MFLLWRNHSHPSSGWEMMYAVCSTFLYSSILNSSLCPVSQITDGAFVSRPARVYRWDYARARGFISLEFIWRVWARFTRGHRCGPRQVYIHHLQCRGRTVGSSFGRALIVYRAGEIRLIIWTDAASANIRTPCFQPRSARLHTTMYFLAVLIFPPVRSSSRRRDY